MATLIHVDNKHTHEENNQKPMIAVHYTSILIMCIRASITHCSDKLFLTISRCPYLCSGPLPAHCSPPTQPPRLTHYLPTLHIRWDSNLSRTHRVGVQHITNRLHEGQQPRHACTNIAQPYLAKTRILANRFLASTSARSLQSRLSSSLRKNAAV